jgi:hypothetical protein
VQAGTGLIEIDEEAPVEPSAGPRPLSSATTDPAPWRASWNAMEEPIIPAPTTATSTVRFT